MPIHKHSGFHNHLSSLYWTPDNTSHDTVTSLNIPWQGDQSEITHPMTQWPVMTRWPVMTWWPVWSKDDFSLVSSGNTRCWPGDPPRWNHSTYPDQTCWWKSLKVNRNNRSSQLAHVLCSYHAVQTCPVPQHAVSRTDKTRKDSIGAEKHGPKYQHVSEVNYMPRTTLLTFFDLLRAPPEF